MLTSQKKMTLLQNKATTDFMDISIVISLYNEAESLTELVAGIHNVLDKMAVSYEIIMVNDGSTDPSWKIIKKMAETDSHVRGISFRRNYGKSAALYCGFEAAQGDVVITMDADLQDDPNEIPELFRMIKEDGYDLVSGWKKKRFDNKLSKNLPSKIYNATARKVTGIKLHDMKFTADQGIAFVSQAVSFTMKKTRSCISGSAFFRYVSSVT